MTGVKKLLIFLFAFIGVVVMAFGITFYAITKFFLPTEEGPASIKPNSILTIKIGHTNLPERGMGARIAQFLGSEGTTSLKSVLRGIYEAAEDNRIKGILLHITGNEIGLAKVQEIRDALIKFKNEGNEDKKFVIAFTDTFGELSNGTISYYLATAADEIWMQPQGYVCLTGLRFEIPFVRDLFNEHGIAPQLARREEYKSLVETYTEMNFSQAYKESMRQTLSNLIDQLVVGISRSRKLKPEQVKKLIDNGPYNEQEALKHKLIDKLAYQDEITSSIRQRVGDDTYMYSLRGYLKRMGPEMVSGDHVAVVYVDGAIQRDMNETAELFDDSEIDGLTTAKSILQAAQEDSVRAIILRVNSPGGSPVASEAIWHAVDKSTNTFKKPVVVSMSDFAASGGYLISCNATKIVAHPASLTGSIGVFGGKVVTSQAWRNLGINWSGLQAGKNASMWSSRVRYTKAEWDKLQAWLDKVYKVFIHKVAKGRNLSSEKVKELAKGRVWTGAEAIKLGLVDVLGGMDKAIEVAKQVGSLKPDEKVTLVEYPKPKTFGQRLFDAINDGSVDLIEHSKPDTVKVFRKFKDIISQFDAELSRNILQQSEMKIR